MKTRNNRFGFVPDLLAIARGRPPGQLIIQMSDICNAACPQCELRKSSRFERKTLPAADIRRMIDKAAENGFQSVSFTGGEPFLHRDTLIELIRHAKAAGIRYIRTGTNGFMFRGHDKPGFDARIHNLAEDLARSGLYTLWISLDSAVPEVHEEMRGLPGVVKGIEKALPILREHGVYPAANLGINRNTGGRYHELAEAMGQDPAEPGALYELFRESFGRFYRRAAELGFTIANACYPMSVETSGGESLDSVYGASSSDHVVSFTGPEKAQLFRALFDTIPEHRGNIRIFTPRSSLAALAAFYETGEAKTYPCPGGIDYFFVAARSGNAFPCGFRGREDLGKFWDIDFESLGRDAVCRRCDWECYRDPAELLGPALDFRRAPLGLARKAASEKGRIGLGLWIEDVRYYRACSFFSGGKPPNYRLMKRFEKLIVETPGESAGDMSLGTDRAALTAPSGPALIESLASPQAAEERNIRDTAAGGIAAAGRAR